MKERITFRQAESMLESFGYTLVTTYDKYHEAWFEIKKDSEVVYFTGNEFCIVAWIHGYIAFCPEAYLI